MFFHTYVHHTNYTLFTNSLLLDAFQHALELAVKTALLQNITGSYKNSNSRDEYYT
jgi:hypothetical protein